MADPVHVFSDVAALAKQYSGLLTFISFIVGSAGGYIVSVKRQAKKEALQVASKASISAKVKDIAAANRLHGEEIKTQFKEVAANAQVLTIELSSLKKHVETFDGHAKKIDDLEDRAAHLESSFHACSSGKADAAKAIEKMFCLKIKALESRLMQQIKHNRNEARREKKQEFESLCGLLSMEITALRAACNIPGAPGLMSGKEHYQSAFGQKADFDERK